jgi:hypothetical protein|tara:strand:+ start:422 stop:766 length:345 start_codon:yes stop_codon:yes gene_type:complete
METRRFYRVSNSNSKQGLWYNYNGEFTGLIHDKFDFCLNSKLPMDYDEEVVGYLSVTDELDNLWGWFTRDDIIRLQEFNYKIHVYESQDYKWYEKFQHWLINQESLKLIEEIEL